MAEPGAHPPPFPDADLDAGAAIRAAPRVCFFAHYHPDGVVSEAVLFQLRAIAAAGFATVILSTAALDEEGRARLEEAGAALVRRANHGLDFGGWQEATARFFPLSAELLLLTNDSVYGPVGDLRAFLDRLTAVPADFYGAVESLQFEPHLQSWFLLLRPAAYRSAAFRRFMTDRIAPHVDKWDIITRYEVELTPALVAEGLRYHAAYRPAANGLIAPDVFFTPTQPLWRELIEGSGVPFIKVELLRDRPLPGGTVADWRRRLEEAGADPLLVRAIRDDLARRRRRSTLALRGRQLGNPRGLADGLYWAMMRGLLRRDYRAGGAPTPAQRRNAALFRRLKRLAGKGGRQPARQRP